MADVAEQVNDKEIQLTVRETELAVAMIQSLEGCEIKLDWNKFVKLTGFANEKSARASVQALKRNLSSIYNEAYYVPHSKAGAKAPPKKPRVRAKAAATVNGGRAAAKAAEGASSKLANGDGGGDEEEEMKGLDKKRAASSELEGSKTKRAKKQPEVKDEEDEDEA
ncbi:MAG: hypothetical protein Q9220_001476 [cf. Caloplaca sp. 1 TL-2023]